jgi:branched-subunit amino acid transport protein AzlD
MNELYVSWAVMEMSVCYCYSDVESWKIPS